MDPEGQNRKDSNNFQNIACYSGGVETKRETGLGLCMSILPHLLATNLAFFTPEPIECYAYLDGIGK